MVPSIRKGARLRSSRLLACFGVVAVMSASVAAVSGSASGARDVAERRPACTIYADGLFTYGTQGPDVICGTPRADIIYGRGGNDVIVGGGDRDLLYGGGGRDRLRGGLGNDQLIGEEGPDLLVGRRGDDTLYDPMGVDRYLGGPGRECFDTVDDRRSVRQQAERVFGGAGRDKARTDDADVRRKIEGTRKVGCMIESVQQ